MNIDKDLEEILEVVYEKGQEGLDKERTIFFNKENAKALIKQVALEVGTMFLQDLGEDDKIEAWKKHVNNGVQ